MWTILIGLGAAILVTWVALVVFLMVARPSRGALREGLRVLPDTVRLLRRMMTDPATPRGVRFRIGLALAYLTMPIDVVPDFIPGIGYADDVIVVAAALRSAVRHAGADAVRRHWPGTADGLSALLRLTRLDREAT